MAKKKSVTPGKLIVIGVLAVVLIAVIVMQTGSGSATPQADSQGGKRQAVQTGRTRRRTPAKTQPASPKAAPAATHREKDWPVKTIAEVIRHDPFALPRSLLPSQTIAQDLMSVSAGSKTDHEEYDQQSAQQRERELALQREVDERLSEIREKGVGMVFLGAGEPLARIGTQDVRVGDIVGGLRIAEIRTNGTVVVEYVDDDR